ncbi:hypothetical protein G3I59_01495 [Amycolatopsis rubida]|uniref:DUF4175 domain-containing protein n=1 Tax=Amycolatopsis rubida TaxID=112413 RepID=A0ABX0BGK0_9PSEU|nr:MULTISPECIES: hypothetical protein [Amycolatopsis]MYW89341.1 hypothetical protein [Amycolatopsis rubida]NEC54319.1 hypothetical protein [Amycolatopsis rubida]OAP21092.1 hypothetical protein A4R44_08067 [Amycolatopsis sp. M39]
MKSRTYWLFAPPALFLVLLLGFTVFFGEPWDQAALGSLTAAIAVLVISFAAETLTRRSRRKG